MFRGILAWLGTRFEREADAERDGTESEGGDRTEAGDEEGTESGFLRSRLDASVLFAHGIRGTADRDAADVEAQARTLEEERRAVERRRRDG